MYRCQLIFRFLYFLYIFFFFNDTATTEIYTLSLHDALPIFTTRTRPTTAQRRHASRCTCSSIRSEEHTSELQSRQYLVCRLLLEKKKKNKTNNTPIANSRTVDVTISMSGDDSTLPNEVYTSD